MYTAATETNRSTGEGEKKCGLLILFALKTRHAAGISSNKKGNEERTQIKLRTECRPSSLALTQQKITSSQGQIVQVSFIKYTISFSIFSFFILSFLQSQQLTNH